MRILAVIFGIVLIVLVAQDAFETIVLPRRVTRRIRLARLFYRVIQMPWRAAGHFMRAGARRDAFLGYLGSLSLLDSRAGSPATAVEILRRNHAGKNVEELRLLLHDWEVR